MLGTDCKSVRCTALEGDVGKGTRCSIYEQRSSTCREFEASWTDGQHNPDCDAARAAFGLAAIAQPSFSEETWPLTTDAVCVA
jgi:Fe-S-cluster containining protein